MLDEYFAAEDDIKLKALAYDSLYNSIQLLKELQLYNERQWDSSVPSDDPATWWWDTRTTTLPVYGGIFTFVCAGKWVQASVVLSGHTFPRETVHTSRKGKYADMSEQELLKCICLWLVYLVYL